MNKFLKLSKLIFVYFFLGMMDGLHAKNSSYSLTNTKCNFELTDQSGGRVGDESGQAFSFFSRRSIPNGGQLNFIFICVSPAVPDYCSKNWENPREENDMSTARLMEIKKYNKFHPDYESLAFSFNATAVAPPLPRSLHFCILKGDVAVTGLVWVGDQKTSQTGTALRVLKTIKIK